MRRPLFALSAAFAAAPVFAAEPARPPVAPLVPCSPTVVFPCPPGRPFPGTPGGGMPGSPGAPGTPGTPNTPPGTPGSPDTPNPGQNTPDTSNAFARQSEGGTQAAASFAPNMFGDLLGARSLRVTYRANAAARFRLVGADFLRDGTQAVVVSPTASGRGTITFTSALDNRVSTIDMTTLAGGRNLDYVQPVILPGALDTTYAARAFELFLARGGLTAAQRAQFDRLTPDQRAELLRNRGLLNTAVAQSLNGLTLPDVRVTALNGTIAGGDVLYNLALQSDARIALPGGSTLVGRVKMSEDNSPIPRDRVIFAYDHFDDVPLTTFGTTVNRFQFGVEKTFLDGRWSAEFRLPFAGTLASTSVQGFEVSHYELGNLRLAVKRILTQSEAFTTTAGVGVTLPTADDQVLLSALDGSALYQYRNRQVTVEPFVAALYTPNDRLFSQLWGSVNFDASGGDLTWDRAVFGGGGAARVHDPALLAVDYQVGYWLIKKDTGTLRGLAPFAELHWNQTLGRDEFLHDINTRGGAGGIVIGGTANQELNLSAGVIAQVGDNLNVSIGASAPLLRQPDRTFDAQVGVRASYLFGRTARARNPINSINSY